MYDLFINVGYQNARLEPRSMAGLFFLQSRYHSHLHHQIARGKFFIARDGAFQQLLDAIKEKELEVLIHYSKSSI